MADGLGSLALYQNEESVRGYSLSLIILRLYRSPLPALLESRYGCHSRLGFLPRPPQHMSPGRYGGQSYTPHDAREMVCL
jgi:hypothetical protein